VAVSDQGAYSLAWMMFARRCTLEGVYDDAGNELPLDSGEVANAWMQKGVRDFWVAEAQAVLDHLAGNPPASPDGK
jgi:hypothetical protein